MIIRLLLLFCCFLMQMTVASATFSMPSELGTSAEMIALGNVEGFSKSSNSVFENPAALYRIKSMGFSFFSSELLNEVNYTSISSAFRWNSFCFWSWLYGAGYS